MSTNKKVVSVVLPPELEERIYSLRGNEEFRYDSMGAILRKLLIAGLKEEGYIKEG